MLVRMRTYLPPLLLLAAVASSQADPQPIVTTDLLKLRTVTSIDVASDGSGVVFVVHAIATEPAADDDEGETYSYRSHLFLLDLLDIRATPRQLTFGKRLDREARFSPDGRRISFMRSDEEDDDGAQVWVMPVDGGEARQVTWLEHGVTSGSGKWAPGSEQILVRSMIRIDEMDGVPPFASERPRRTWDDAGPGTGSVPRPDGTRAEIRRSLAENAADKDPVVISRLDFQLEQELGGAPQFGHLFLVAADGSDADARRITDGFHDHGAASFMPDGRSIVYTANKTPGVHPDRLLGTDIWRINVDGTDDRRLLWIDGYTLEDPQPNKDGSLIAFAAQQLDEPAFRQRRLGLGSSEGLDGGEPIVLTPEQTFDASVYDFQWMPDQTAVLFTAAVRGGFPLLTVSPGLLEPASIVAQHDGQAIGVRVFDAAAGATVYAMTTPSQPCALMVRDSRGQRLAYDLNPWIADKVLSMPTEAWLVRPDGTRVQYWVMEPTGREAGTDYPLVLEIHGGPSAMWGPGEFTMWHEFQLLCSWGYGVAYCNPRGSGGYGYGFQRGNYQDWGDGPAGDVLGMLDQVMLKDWVDEDRLVVTGGSYAGYLTAWIVAHDHRFKAAVAQRGVYDLATFFGEGNAWRLVEWSMGGNPSDTRYRTIIDRNSPITYVNNIRTPLLIMHASSDLRTGISQSEMLYRSLKALDRPVEYVRYPDSGHDLSRSGPPHRRLDRLNRIIEFFERHVENSRPAPFER
ncbi:MAG: S9 family peptidase [Planctomycetota bacterium]|nr:MAG: S9 family peptidase [Planctomycetota bacterium]